MAAPRRAVQRDRCPLGTWSSGGAVLLALLFAGPWCQPETDASSPVTAVPRGRQKRQSTRKRARSHRILFLWLRMQDVILRVSPSRWNPFAVISPAMHWNSGF